MRPLYPFGRPSRPFRSPRGSGQVSHAGSLNVALVIPRSGPAGMFGPSCELSARLAAAELNAADGADGRPVRLLTVDGGAAPGQVAERIDRLISVGAVDAVVGWHISAVRQALAPRVRCRVPYVYTALYEGGERTPGIFMTGETPARQLLPAMRVLAQSHGVRRWCVVGNDYVWPRATAAAARGYARQCGARIAAEAFVPLGTGDFTHVLSKVERCAADAVLVLLVGEDAVRFNRAFAGARLHERALRLSTLMDETMLLASGPEATAGLWSAAGYFETLATPESLSFGASYARRFGVHAPPVGSPGESCYEGLKFLAALVGSARPPVGPARPLVDLARLPVGSARPLLGSARPPVGSASPLLGSVGRHGSRRRLPWTAAGDPTRTGLDGYEGARGVFRLRGNHVEQPVYLAEADGLDFHVRQQL